MKHKFVVKTVNAEGGDLGNKYSLRVWGIFFNMTRNDRNFAILQNGSMRNFKFHFVFH